MVPRTQPLWLQKEMDASMYFRPQGPELNPTLAQFVKKCMIYLQPDIFEGTEKLFL